MSDIQLKLRPGAGFFSDVIQSLIMISRYFRENRDTTSLAYPVTGAKAGFGARMLVGDQYGQPILSWAALFAAALTAAALVGIISLVERGALRKMGMKPA